MWRDPFKQYSLSTSYNSVIYNLVKAYYRASWQCNCKVHKTNCTISPREKIFKKFRGYFMTFGG